MFSLKAHTSSMDNEEQKTADKMWLQIDLANDEIMAWSSEEVIGGFKWCFEAKLDDPRDNGKMMMVITIGCNQQDEFLNQLWFAKCRFSISMNAWKFDTKYNRYFLNGHNVYKTEVEPGEKMRFMLDLEVLRSNSQNKMMALDTDLRFSIAISNNENDDKKEMVVKIITVNKLALASISGYFNNLFFGLWSERSSNTDFVDIKEEPNFDWKAFELMVYSAMSMGWMVHESEILEDKTALEILKLSIKYDIPMMQNYCEEYMVKSVTFPKMQLLEVGEQLGIGKLMEHALSTITLQGFGKEFGQNCEIRARLSDKTTKLLDKRLEDEANGVKEEKKKETGKKRFHNYDELYDENDDWDC